MALVKCPECEKEISDKAMTCPGCGYVVRQAEEKQYELRVPKQVVASSYGNMLRTIAIFVWIFGGICAIVLSLQITSYGDVKGFDFWTFLGYAGATALSGLAIKCLADFFNDICTIRHTLQGLKLEVSDRKTAASGSHSDDWRCKKCGMKNSAAKISCWSCGAYK